MVPLEAGRKNTAVVNTAVESGGGRGVQWVFGYGSLIWRPAFPFVESRPAFIEGWVRRFWQGSSDHRGTPQAPGRVVTLVRNAGGLCWGRAFRLARHDWPTVLEQLDVREQGGYERHEVSLRWGRQSGEAPSRREVALVYLATSENPNYLGPASTEHIARQVAASHGPSGANTQYVFELESALHQIGEPDAHLSEVAQAVRRVQAEE